MRALRFTPWSPRAAYAAVAGRWRPDAWAGGAGSPLRLVEMPSPALPGQAWVRVDVSLGGVCGSDLKILHVRGLEPVTFAYTRWRQPIVPGHEIVGVVSGAGRHAGIAEGTRVVAEPLLSCRDRGREEDECSHCRSGLFWHCDAAPDGGSLDPGQGFGFNARYGGGWAQQLVAPASRCVPVPDQLDDTDAVLAEPLSVAIRAVQRASPPPGGRALVIGPGPIGLCVLIALRALHPDVEIAVAGLGGFADDLCRDLGADVLLHGRRAQLLESAATSVGAILRRGPLGPPVLDRGGFDVVYDCVGSNQTIDDAARMLRPGGHLGLVATAGRQQMDWSLIWFRELRVSGTICYRNDGRRRDMQTAVDVLSDVRPGTRLVTHTFSLDAAPQALKIAAAGPGAGAVKVAFRP